MKAENERKSDCREVLTGKSDRRTFLKALTAAAGSAALTTGCMSAVEAAGGEELKLRWQEFFKKNYRLMTQEEKDATVARLERLAKLQSGMDIQMGSYLPLEGVLWLTVAMGLLRVGLGRTILLFAFVLFAVWVVVFSAGAILVSF